MKTQIRKQFADKLVKNAHRQIRGRLNMDDKVCAVGLLHEMHKQENTTQLMHDWAGMTNQEIDKIVNANDWQRLSFPKIAQMIMEDPAFDDRGESK